VNFSDVFTDLASQHKTRPANEFTNKIVIIGSTAPGLFDIKPTAMDKQFPGVEILATAIDNVKHRDYLKVWRGKTPYVLLSLLLIWSTTLAFYLKVDREKFNSIFTGGQIGLLVLSYIGINFTNTYLDLTGPILWAVALFGIAKIYALATERALQRWLALGSKHQDQELAVTMLAVIIESREVLGDALMKVIKRRIELIAKTPCNIEHIHGTQSGIWGLFGDMLVISWVYAPQNTERPSQIQQDILHMMQELPKIIDQLGLPNLANVRYSTHEGKIAQHQLTDAEVASQWRTLFAQAVIKLEQSDSN
jgi:hypothetical protein